MYEEETQCPLLSALKCIACVTACIGDLVFRKSIVGRTYELAFICSWGS